MNASVSQSLLRFLDDSKGDWIGEEQLYHAGHYRPHCPVGPPDRRCSIAQRLRLADADAARSRSRALSRASRTALLHYCTTAPLRPVDSLSYAARDPSSTRPTSAPGLLRPSTPWRRPRPRVLCSFVCCQQVHGFDIAAAGSLMRCCADCYCWVRSSSLPPASASPAAQCRDRTFRLWFPPSARGRSACLGSPHLCWSAPRIRPIAATAGVVRAECSAVVQCRLKGLTQGLFPVAP